MWNLGSIVELIESAEPHAFRVTGKHHSATLSIDHQNSIRGLQEHQSDSDRRAIHLVNSQNATSLKAVALVSIFAISLVIETVWLPAIKFTNLKLLADNLRLRIV